MDCPRGRTSIANLLMSCTDEYPTQRCANSLVSRIAKANATSGVKDHPHQASSKRLGSDPSRISMTGITHAENTSNTLRNETMRRIGTRSIECIRLYPISKDGLVTWRLDHSFCFYCTSSPRSLLLACTLANGPYTLAISFRLLLAQHEPTSDLSLDFLGFVVS